LELHRILGVGLLHATLRLYFNAMSGSTGKNGHYSGPRYLHSTFVQIDQNR